MKNFPEGIRFKFEWRKYQQRVLDNLNLYLKDNHLHIIAPPGSGKTVLGLEAALRINKPTLILAPTVAIKNQWISRFCELFLQTKRRPEWISANIKNPAFLTIATYQALYAAIRGNLQENNSGTKDSPHLNGLTVSEPPQLIKSLREIGMSVVVLDEAHHLRNEWWKCLSFMINILKPTTIGLTATPPYDVSYNEWQRYIHLNGPVDEEISVPELVSEGDLCPHQDYVYISKPCEEEQKLVNEHTRSVYETIQDTVKNPEITQALLNHPFFISPVDNIEKIYERIEFYSALLIYLNHQEIKISNSHLNLIGVKESRLPELTDDWLEILLSWYLLKIPGDFPGAKNHQEKLLKILSERRILEGTVISFGSNENIVKALGSSMSKMESIIRIVETEFVNLGQELRMVILTDYIRREFLPDKDNKSKKLTKIGVIPIFEKLRKEAPSGIRLGVLTGSIVILHKSVLEILEKETGNRGIDNLCFSQYPGEKDYLIIKLNARIRNIIVQIVTKIFESGRIETLIGTKSLLGEGWDAPSINSLILASFVGSFVSSNQMRGRAIRKDPARDDKTGNIWHLVCASGSLIHGGDDVDILSRRFRAFTGINYTKPFRIENGVERLNLPILYDENGITGYNKKITQYAGEREKLKKSWARAIEKGVSLKEEIKRPFDGKMSYKRTKAYYSRNTIKNLSFSLLSALASYAHLVLNILNRAWQHVESVSTLLNILSAAGIAAFLLYGYRTVNLLRLYVKYRDIAKDTGKIAEALLNTLIEMGEIRNEDNISVNSIVSIDGTVNCRLSGGTLYENSIFVKSLKEILDPIDNPRYIIIRTGIFLNIFRQYDYHAVPELIGKNKKWAGFFAQEWYYCVGRCRYIFTRTVHGRRALLKARMNSLSSEFRSKSERKSVWK